MQFVIMHKTNAHWESLDDAGRWAKLYIDTVEGDEVDVREIEPR